MPAAALPLDPRPASALSATVSRPDGRCRANRLCGHWRAVEESPGSRDWRWRRTGAGGGPQGKGPEKRPPRGGRPPEGKGGKRREEGAPAPATEGGRRTPPGAKPNSGGAVGTVGSLRVPSRPRLDPGHRPGWLLEALRKRRPR